MTSNVGSSDDIEFSEWTQEVEAGRWYVDLGGVRLGPLDRESLLEMYESGNLRTDDRIQDIRTKRWSSLRTLLVESSQRTDSDTSGGDRYLFSARDEGRSDDSIEEAFDVEGEPLDGCDEADAVNSNEGVPQYFFIINDREVGPVPFDTLQELAAAAEIEPTTRIKLESSIHWMTAKELGVRFAASHAPQAKTAPKRSEHRDVRDPNVVEAETSATESSRVSDLNRAGRSVAEGAFWTVLAPLHYVSAVVSPLGSVKRTLVLTWAALAGLGGWLAYSMYWDIATTATSGVILIGDEPLPSALITLTNMTNAETAVGFSNSSGSFSVKTMSGDLRHGRYRITVVRPKEYESSNLPAIPLRYQLVTSSDIDIDYEGQSLRIEIAKE